MFNIESLYLLSSDFVAIMRPIQDSVNMREEYVNFTPYPVYLYVPDVYTNIFANLVVNSDTELMDVGVSGSLDIDKGVFQTVSFQNASVSALDCTGPISSDSFLVEGSTVTNILQSNRATGGAVHVNGDLQVEDTFSATVFNSGPVSAENATITNLYTSDIICTGLYVESLVGSMCYSVNVECDTGVFNNIISNNCTFSNFIGEADVVVDSLSAINTTCTRIDTLDAQELTVDDQSNVLTAGFTGIQGDSLTANTIVSTSISATTCEVSDNMFIEEISTLNMNVDGPVSIDKLAMTGVFNADVIKTTSFATERDLLAVGNIDVLNNMDCSKNIFTNQVVGQNMKCLDTLHIDHSTVNSDLSCGGSVTSTNIHVNSKLYSDFITADTIQIDELDAHTINCKGLINTNELVVNNDSQAFDFIINNDAEFKKGLYIRPFMFLSIDIRKNLADMNTKILEEMGKLIFGFALNFQIYIPITPLWPLGLLYVFVDDYESFA
jgi:hypothetical protein